MSSSALQTPHSGYHGGYHGRGGSERRFFEGWYLRVTLPSERQSFAWMYSIDDPTGGTPYSGGAVQVLGPDEAYFCRTLPQVKGFWAARDRLAFGHWLADEGYRVTATLSQGQLSDPISGKEVRWRYETTPVYGWGTRSQQPTAGWLSFLPVFDPGWQVLMAHGLATGWVEWQGQRYAFDRAPAYAEKNWGSSFPTQWFWLQCNAFEQDSDLTVTAAGGLRQVLGQSEAVGLVGLHHRGEFYAFVSTRDRLAWRVSPWGHWRVTAQRWPYRIELVGETSDRPARVRVPTQSGLQFRCRDTTHGRLQLRLWERHRLVLSASSALAGLEVGGEPWPSVWEKD